MFRGLGAMIVVLSGTFTASIGNVLGQTSPTTDPSTIAPWVSAGGSVTAVGGIVYIARLLATGRLVARDPAEVEKRLQTLVDEVSAVAEEGHQREVDYLEFLKARVSEYLGQPKPNHD